VIRPSHRLRASIFLGAVAAALLAGCSGSASPAPSPAPTSPVAATTVSKTFSPYDSAGAQVSATATKASGNCWTSSIALPSTTTFRCFAGNSILDPCFAPPHVSAPKTVACFADPWSSGVLLTLTAALPKPDPGTRTSPWALELANGAHCVAVTGTVDQVGALNLGYDCGGISEAGLQGAPGSALSVEYRSSAAQPLRPVAVRTAWR
jgi:hypothetical protein